MKIWTRVALAAAAFGVVDARKPAFRPQSLLPEGTRNRPSALPPPPLHGGGGAAQKSAVKKNAVATKDGGDPWKAIKEFVVGDRFPWLVCSLLSIYYFSISMKSQGGPSPPKPPPGDAPEQHANDGYSKDGFCVTGLDTATKMCSKKAGNSHQFAWGIDVLYTLLAVIVPFSGIAKTDLTLWYFGNAVVVAALIVGHGFLHRVFSTKSCDLSEAMSDSFFISACSKAVPSYNVAYALFVFVLTLVDLLGYSSIPAMFGYPAVFVISTVITLAIVKVTNENKSVSNFFMISHLLVSLTGLVVPNPHTVTPQLGWSFILPCIVSLVEFMDCANFLVQYGGHSWYDFFLHLSMIVSLLFGTYNFPSKLDNLLHAGKVSELK